MSGKKSSDDSQRLLTFREDTYNLEITRGHIVMLTPEHGRVLLDTGFPTSCPLPRDGVVNQYLGPLDWLAGMDALGTSPWVLDVPNHKLRFGAQLASPCETLEVTLDARLGVPQIPIVVGGFEVITEDSRMPG